MESACWWWPHHQYVIVSERPSVIHREQVGPQGWGSHRLHCEDGPAIAWQDWPLYFWHGRQVEEWVITGPTPERIAAEANVEVRRCAIESMGWDRFIVSAELVAIGPPEPDPGNPGQTISLYDVPERLWGDRVRLLVATNGTPERDGTRRVYGLTCPPEFGIPSDAAGWSYGLTGQEYRALARRT